MQKQATPVMIAIAVIVLIVVLFVIYKFTLGKSGGAGGEATVGPPPDLQQSMGGKAGPMPVPQGAPGGQ